MNLNGGDQWARTVGETGGVIGLAPLEEKGGKLVAPDNMVMTVDAARSYYTSFKGNSRRRIKLISGIQGLIAGNPPYNPATMKAAGLSHVSNFNTLDAKAKFEQACTAYWNLFNQTETLVRFGIRKFEGTQDHDYVEWGDTLSRNFTKVILEMWPEFLDQMNLLTSQLVQIGASPLVWSDERDFRWETIDLARLYCADDTPIFPDKWDTMLFESPFSIQFLYNAYTKWIEDSPWDRQALHDFILKRANERDKGHHAYFVNIGDMEKAIRQNSFNYAPLFSDRVPLISLLKREFDDTITHYIFDPTGDVNEFLFFLPDKYKRFDEVLSVFTYSPDVKEIHGNQGFGHKIYSLCQAMLQIDNNIVDATRMAGTPIIRSNGGLRSTEPIRFISGVPTDIGIAEFAQNNLGTNITGMINSAQYFDQKIDKNSLRGGDNPSQPDSDRGSKSAPEAMVAAYKEFGVSKQHISHFYRRLDSVYRQMVSKMLRCKEGHPGYEIVEEWKELCIEDGVPEEVFEIPKDTPDGMLPRRLSVRAARAGGDGSNVGMILGLRGIQPIVGGLSSKGQANYRKDLIMVNMGKDFVERYDSDEFQADEAGAGASVAQLENLVMKAGEMPQATRDNDQKVHLGSHFALGQQIIEQVQSQKMDPIGADKIFTALIPHMQEHIKYVETDSLNQSYLKQIEGPFRQMFKFAQLNRVTAEKMMKAEVRRRAEAEQQMNADAIDQQRKDMIASREQDRKDMQAQAKESRAKEQSDVKADIMRRSTDAKAENERRKIELQAENESQKIRTPKEILADRSTADLQQTLIDQVGTSPNPADFT